ncbi:MAG: hypothetical protein JWO06_3323 [Bacteroidota bacterium]|nr:hypothetical protein [Bacteroidota bacterium]
MTNQKHSNLRIGIAGKRDIAADTLVREEIKKSILVILKKEKTKPFVAYSAMAKGADTIFADVVKKEFSQEIKIVLPFDSAEYEKDFTNATDLSEYKNWLNTAGISEVVTKDIPKSQEQRNEAYLSVGKFLVDNCDYMIFIWDELKPRGKGGTAEILGYASQCPSIKGIEIIKVLPNKTDEINSEINSLLQTSDNRAVKLKKTYEEVWIVSILLGWLTALCFSSTLSFQFNHFGQLIFSCLELAFIFTVFVLIRITKKQELHPNLLKERLRAEKLRFLVAYYHADIPVSISEITHETDSELANVAGKVNASISNSYQSKWYKYFAIKTLIQSQKKYHHNISANVIGKKTEKLKAINTTIYIAWLLILFSHLFSLFLTCFNIYIPILSDYAYPTEIGRFLAISLPATYAGIEGFLFFKEWENFKTQSDTMSNFLSQKQIQLDESELSNDGFLQILNSVSIAMLADNKNWHLILSKKETPHPIL